jgi:glycosyltransferase involved in cell wall biosynthesis
MAVGGAPLAAADAARPQRRIKVLYVCTALNRGSGGERRPLMLASGVDRSRFDFAICVIERASPAVIAEMKNASCTFYSLDLSRRLYNPVGLARIFFRLYRLFSELRPDVVQTHALHANLLARPAARLAGVKVLISTENVLPDVERQIWRRALNAPLHALNRYLDRRTDRIVVASEAVRRWKDANGRSPKIHVVGPPLDLDAFKPAPSRAATGAGGCVLGVVGRLSREKGHALLIAAMGALRAERPDAQLLIVGSGPLEAELRAQVEALDLGGCVQFLGYLQDIPQILSRLSILVVPSLSDALPRVALEGMLMELPVVGTRTGGIAEIILDGETGLLVPPGDSAALARACGHLLSHPEEGSRMGRRGRERVLSAFHPAQFIARHEELYATALGGAPAARR